MIICGGGAKSDLWMQIFADIYHKKIVVTNVDQDAASLGAAAIAARGAGFWKDYSPLDELFEDTKILCTQMLENRDRYAAIAKTVHPMGQSAWRKLHDRLNDEQKYR